jgi:hypothetical protein
MNEKFKDFLTEKLQLNGLKIPKFEYHTNVKLVLEADEDENSPDDTSDTGSDMDPPKEPESNDLSSDNSR